jgi:hypothetical protein
MGATECAFKIRKRYQTNELVVDSTEFGTRGSEVQILSPRPIFNVAAQYRKFLRKFLHLDKPQLSNQYAVFAAKEIVLERARQEPPCLVCRLEMRSRCNLLLGSEYRVSA